jgi:hypothetical protein
MIEVKILVRYLLKAGWTLRRKKIQIRERPYADEEDRPVACSVAADYTVHTGSSPPVLVPRGATWPRPVLNRNSPEGNLLSTVSSPPIPFSRVQLLIYVNIPLYPFKTHGSRKCIKSRVWPDPFASSTCNFVIENKVLTVLHIPRTL